MAKGSKFAELKKKERETRKQIIIKSALSLFANKNFYDVGMRDIAEEAGVSPATLYRYFPCQEDLFIEAFLNDISSVTSEFENMVKREKPATIEEFAVAYVDHIFQNESTFQMITYLMLKDNLAHPAMGKFDSVTKVFFDLCAELFERYGVKENVRFYAHSFVASMTGIIMTFRNHPVKAKKIVREHILRLTRMTAAMYSHELLT